MQRWAVFLSAYQYDVKFKGTQFHANADGLSRLPLENCSMEGLSIEPSIYNISQIDFLPITAAKVKMLLVLTQFLAKFYLSFLMDCGQRQ